MDEFATPARAAPLGHDHVFLGEAHDTNARRTWWVIALCTAMMALEIVGGLVFGSIALVADGLHMSTHAGALLLAALAYSYARQHATDPRFSFGTGKLGDLAGFSSAIVLAMIALLIGYEAVTRLVEPVTIRFSEAIPIACLGLAVNVASVWLLSAGGHHHHHHGHGHDHAHAHAADPEEHRILLGEGGAMLLSLHEGEGVPPRFRARFEDGATRAKTVSVETERPDGVRQSFAMVERGAFLESADVVPEPHAFAAHVRAETPDGQVRRQTVVYTEPDSHDHGAAGHHRDNNMRAALVHVMADAAVSVLVIVGLVLARTFGWLWMDPLAGLVGALVIASWSYGLIRDTGAILLDMTPDPDMARGIRNAVEANGDQIADLHLWRLGPGHLGAILSVVTAMPRDPTFYRQSLAARYRSLAHITVEVTQRVA